MLLGKKENPYPYIQACDYYIQPSRYEGKSVTVREAQLLGKPVIVADYPTAKSQILDKVTGFIVPLENVACAQGIVNILKNQDDVLRVVQNISQKDFENSNEVQKIYQII